MWFWSPGFSLLLFFSFFPTLSCRKNKAIKEKLLLFSSVSICRQGCRGRRQLQPSACRSCWWSRQLQRRRPGGRPSIRPSVRPHQIPPAVKKKSPPTNKSSSTKAGALVSPHWSQELHHPSVPSQWRTVLRRTVSRRTPRASSRRPLVRSWEIDEVQPR